MEDGFQLIQAQAIYQNNVILFLKYLGFVGYLTVQAHQDTMLDLTPAFADLFQLLHKCDHALMENMIICDNHRLIALSTNCTIRVS